LHLLAGDAGGAGSEDCLKVNVYAPASAKRGDNREFVMFSSYRNSKGILVPVLVYIHGGGSLFASAMAENLTIARRIQIRQSSQLAF